MKSEKYFINVKSQEAKDICSKWGAFLEEQKFNFERIQKIDLNTEIPVIYDIDGNKFSIDFANNRMNYGKIKGSIKTELISKALGGGKYGIQVLDLSAGLGIDAVFLAQLGYTVTAIERNPLIYLALSNAINKKSDLRLKFEYGQAKDFLNKSEIVADVIYFDPMFPEKSKSALPRQEMVFFKNLVGKDEDASEVLNIALRAEGVMRIVVKRPLSANALLRPISSMQGKLIRFDLYNGAKKT